MITQNMVGGWYVDAIVSELVPFKFDGFLHNDDELFSTLIQFFNSRELCQILDSFSIELG